jgi:tetratricopeptide (TPR) repeat protein
VLKREEDFHKILLFLSINHPDQFPEYISPEKFSKKYEIKKTTLDYYLDEIVANQIYTVRFFKLEVSPDKHYYFQSNEKIEKMLKVITEEHISKFTYLNKLFEKTEKIIPALDMSSTVSAILEEACQNAFNNEFKDSLRVFLPDYINYLAYKIEKERKLTGVSDKLEGIIWQNIPDILERTVSGDSQYQYMGQSEMNYFIDPAILEIIEPSLEIKSGPFKKKILKSLAEKDYSDVLDIIEPVIKSDKDDLNLIILKALVLCYLNRSDEANEFLKNEIDLSSIKEEEQIFTAYSIISAFSYMTIGDFGNAIKIVDETLETCPNYPISHALKGLVLGYNLIFEFDPERADNENGIVNLERAIDLESFESNKARYYQLISQIFLELSDFEDAIASIDNAIKFNPGKVDFYNSKNRILIYFDQYEEVMALLDKMEVDFPEDEKDIKIKKAYILKERKNVEEGLEIINELIKKYPEDNNLLLNKAYWLQNLERKEAALKIIQDLIDRDPENGVYHDTRGEILMSYEEYGKAINEFLKAIEISGNNWYIYQTYIKLGICYKELEDFNTAVENFSRGKELTNKYLIDIDSKRKWLQIADLYLAQIAELESDF